MQSKTEGLEKVYPLAYSFSPLVHLVSPDQYMLKRRLADSISFNVSVKINGAHVCTNWEVESAMAIDFTPLSTFSKSLLDPNSDFVTVVDTCPVLCLCSLHKSPVY